LIAASVWTAPEIENPLGAWIVRFRPETMPPDGDGRLARLEVAGAAERDRLEAARDLRRVDADHREVGGAVGAEQLDRDGVAVLAEADLQRGGAVDDVLVGDDVALVVDHEARPGGLAVLLVGLDEDDAGGDAAVDALDVDGAAVRRRRRDGGRRGRRGGGAGARGLVGVGAAVVEDPGEGQDADDGCNGHSPGEEGRVAAHGRTIGALLTEGFLKPRSSRHKGSL
jgi:hypothetical protein